MAEASGQSGEVSRFGLFIVIACAFVWSTISLPFGPLHADEAVQWSLAKELAEGTPYSTHQDKFHGPTLRRKCSLMSVGAVPVALAARSSAVASVGPWNLS